MIEEAAAIESPRGDRHYDRSDAEKDARNGKQFEPAYRRHEHAEKAFDGPANNPQLAEVLDHFRHETGRDHAPPSALVTRIENVASPRVTSGLDEIAAINTPKAVQADAAAMQTITRAARSPH